MLNSISLIRVLSCLAIAIFHITRYVTVNYPGIDLTFSLAGPGFHLFLQISGFVLVYITNSDDRPLRFMMKRAARIVPLYWVTTTVAIFVISLEPWLFTSADMSLPAIVKSYLFLPSIDKINHIHPILFVGWTLNYMMLFYGLFSLSLLAPRRWQTWFAIAGLFSVMALAHLLPEGAARTFYTRPILLEFASGCLVGMALRNPKVIAWVKVTPVWPIMVLGVVGLLCAMQAHLDGLPKVLAYSPSAAALVFACAAKDMYKKPLQGALIHRLGLLSFGVYLIHPIVIPILGALVANTVGKGWVGTGVLYVSTIACTVLLADIAHQMIEKPSNKWIRAKFNLAPSMPQRVQAQSPATT
jgi:exopolysaccharide production protein ExoZ